MMASKRSFTDKQIELIVELREEGLQWAEVAQRVSKAGGSKRTAEAVRHAWRAYGPTEIGSADAQVALLKSARRAKQTASKDRKFAAAVTDVLNFQDDLVDRIQELIRGATFPKPSASKPPKHDDAKRNMTKELLISDVHVGKRTETFDLAVCEDRLNQVVKATLDDIERDSKTYNVERLVVAMLGDLIENFEMHGLESARGCEFGNAEQVEKAIALLFHCLLVPLAETGIPITAVGIAGNHDRTEPARSHHDVGKTYLTWVIYSTLELLCKAAKINNIEFKIPYGPYHVESIYGNNVLYEHGDLVRRLERERLERQLSRRQTQVGKVLHFMRIGHFHEPTVFGQGRVIVNGSVPGQDSFADSLGFDSQAVQMLVDYIETDNRPTCFFRAFPIYLT
jgi:predicted phosphodiesterase